MHQWIYLWLCVQIGRLARTVLHPIRSVRVRRSIKLLGQPDQRTAAIDNLIELGAVHAREPLLSALQNKRRRVREGAAKALGQLGDNSNAVIDALIASLEDVCDEAAHALGHLGDRRAVEPLMRVLKESGWVSAARALGELGDVRACETLLLAIGAGNGELRLAAAHSLLALGDPVWSDAIQGGATIDDDLGRLRRCGDHRAIIPLVRALFDSSSGFTAAARQLGLLGDPQAVVPLLAAAKRWETECAIGVAVSAIAKLDRTTAIEFGIKMLRNNTHAIAPVLGELGDRGAVKPLIDVLKPDEEGAAAARALGQLGDPRAIHPIIETMKHSGRYGWSFCQTAAEVLKTLCPPDAMEHPLIQVCHHYPREDMIDALCGLKANPRDPMPLVRVLVHQEPSVRQAGAKTLAELGEPGWREMIKGDSWEEDLLRIASTGDPRLVAPLAKELEHPGWEVRKAAAHALIRLCSAGAVLPQNIVNLVRVPHNDGHVSSSWPCGHTDEHRDVGIGLDLPGEPTNQDKDF